MAIPSVSSPGPRQRRDHVPEPGERQGQRTGLLEVSSDAISPNGTYIEVSDIPGAVVGLIKGHLQLVLVHSFPTMQDE